MVNIPAVLIHPKTKGYRLTRGDFEFVRAMIISTKRDTEAKTSEQVRKLMKSSLKFSTGQGFKLSVGALSVDLDNFSIEGRGVELSNWDKHYMSTLIKCAAASTCAMIVLPSYIVVRNGSQPADTQPPKKRPVAKRKPRKSPKDNV